MNAERQGTTHRRLTAEQKRKMAAGRRRARRERERERTQRKKALAKMTGFDYTTPIEKKDPEPVSILALGNQICADTLQSIADDETWPVQEDRAKYAAWAEELRSAS